MSQERVCFRPNTHLIGEGSPIDAGRRHPRRRYRRRRRRRRSVGVAVGVVLRLLRRQAARQSDAQLGNVAGDFFGAAAADHEIGDGTRRQRHGTARPRRRRHLKFMKKKWFKWLMWQKNRSRNDSTMIKDCFSNISVSPKTNFFNLTPIASVAKKRNKTRR